MSFHKISVSVCLSLSLSLAFSATHAHMINVTTCTVPVVNQFKDNREAKSRVLETGQRTINNIGVHASGSPMVNPEGQSLTRKCNMFAHCCRQSLLSRARRRSHRATSLHGAGAMHALLVAQISCACTTQIWRLAANIVPRAAAARRPLKHGSHSGMSPPVSSC